MTPRDADLRAQLPDSWHSRLRDEVALPYFAELARFVEEERRAGAVYPPAEQVFAAFTHTPWERVRVLLLGQDPYHDEGQAHGLCFSVPPGVRPPPSLRNIFKELRDDLGHPIPARGDLTPWARKASPLR